MTDTAVVHIGENSPEEVAYKLMRLVREAEDFQPNTRAHLLDLYAECLLAVKTPAARLEEGMII